MSGKTDKTMEKAIEKAIEMETDMAPTSEELDTLMAPTEAISKAWAELEEARARLEFDCWKKAESGFAERGARFKAQAPRLWGKLLMHVVELGPEEAELVMKHLEDFTYEMKDYLGSMCATLTFDKAAEKIVSPLEWKLQINFKKGEQDQKDKKDKKEKKDKDEEKEDKDEEFEKEFIGTPIKWVKASEDRDGVSLARVFSAELEQDGLLLFAEVLRKLYENPVKCVAEISDYEDDSDDESFDDEDDEDEEDDQSDDDSKPKKARK